MMDLVVAALVAGAAAGAGETASTAVRDAYEGLKSVTLRVLRRNGSSAAGDVVEADLVGEGENRGEVETALNAAGEDAELANAARRVLELVDPEGGVGKYRVVAKDNKAVQVGDHNTQTNTFN